MLEYGKCWKKTILASFSLLYQMSWREKGREERFSLVYYSRGKQFTMVRKTRLETGKACGLKQELLVTVNLHTHETESEQEVGLGSTFSRPTPRDLLPPVRLHCQCFDNLSKHHHHLQNKYSSYREQFTLKPPQRFFVFVDVLFCFSLLFFKKTFAKGNLKFIKVFSIVEVWELT